MALTRRIGFQTSFQYNVSGSSTAYVTAGAVVNAVEGAEATAELVDISILSDTFKQFRKGMIDPGQMTFQIAYDPSDTDNQNFVNMFYETDCSVVPLFRFTFTDCGSTAALPTESFNALVVGLSGPNYDRESLISRDVTLQVTSGPGFTT